MNIVYGQKNINPGFNALAATLFMYDSHKFDKGDRCVKGKKCGDVCIPKKFKCRQRNKFAISKNIQKNTMRSLRYTATLTGLSTTAILATRNLYRKNIPNAAKKAEVLSNKIDLDTLPDFTGKRGYVMLMPGFAGQMGKTRQENIERLFADNFSKDIGEDYGLHLLSNTKFNIGTNIPDYIPPDFDPTDLSSYSRVSENAKQVTLNLVDTLMGSLIDKENKQSIEATAYMLAMEKKFKLQNPGVEPERKGIGYSAGGMVLSDSNMQLKSLREKDVDFLTIGSPYFGFTDETSNMVKINSARDMAVGKLPHGRSIEVNDVSDHLRYHENNKVREIIQSFLYDGAKLTNLKYLGLRSDSLDIRLDKRQKCVKGKPCGDVCIPKAHKCQQKISSGDYTRNPKTGKEYTIRELKSIAKKKQVYRYSDLDKKGLQTALKDADKPREERERISKSFTNYSSPSQKAVSIAFQGKDNQKTRASARSTVKTLKNLQAIAKFADTQPAQWGTAATAMFLVGQGIRSYNKMRSDYRANFKSAANQAAEKALTMSPPRPGSKDNITFVVGSNVGNTEKIRNKFTEIGINSEKTEDQFFANQHFIDFSLKENEFNESGNAVKDSVNIAKSYMQNIKRGKNQDAVELAANIYALGIQRDKASKNSLVNKNKKINIITDQLGGQTAKEALEYLSRIDVKGQPSGKSILEQVNMVSLGTPHFGFTENVSKRQKTIVSNNEPLANIPVWGEESRPEWISSVKGNKVEDYLSDDRVLQSIRESFGFYEDSLLEIARKKKKKQQKKTELVRGSLL